jgi:hypothetical protein
MQPQRQQQFRKHQQTLDTLNISALQPKEPAATPLRLTTHNLPLRALLLLLPPARVGHKQPLSGIRGLIALNICQANRS